MYKIPNPWLVCLYMCGCVENYTVSINFSKCCNLPWDFVAGTQQQHWKQIGTFQKPSLFYKMNTSFPKYVHFVIKMFSLAFPLTV